MRRLSPLLVLLFVTPALAETLDCAMIKSAAHPLELTFGFGKPFDFNEVVKGADGTVVSDVNTSVSFDGAGNVEVGGCTYTLTKIIEQSHGSVRGMAGSNRAGRWYSRDLKTSLYTRSEEGDGSIVETRGRDISTSFTPVE